MAKSVIDAIAPAVIFVVSLRSIAEEQIKNSEFDLRVGIDNKSSRDPEISFNRVPRSVETPGTFTKDFTTERRRQRISAVSRERLTLFLLHFTFRQVPKLYYCRSNFHRVTCSHKHALDSNVQISPGTKKVLFTILYSSQTLF